MRLSAVLAAAALAALPVRAAPAGDSLVIKAKRVITVSGAEILDGRIVIADGKIRAVGKDVAIPDGATIVDAEVAMPGMVEGCTQYGLSGRGNEEAREVIPELRVIDDVDPKSKDFQRALQRGVTTTGVEPGDRDVIGGLGAVMKTWGASLADVLVKEDSGLKAVVGSAPSRGNYPPRGMPPVNFYARRPTTRMGVVWEFRRAFLGAAKYREEGGPAKNEGNDVLLRVLDKKLPLRIQASRATDIETAIKLADEFGLSFSIEEADEAYRHAEALAKRGAGVFLRPSFLTRSITSSEGSEVCFAAFAALGRAGVKTALLPAGDAETDGPLATAAFAVKYGAPPADALRALTLTPAELLGVSDRVGSLEPGKDADVVLLTGDPLALTTRIERVLVGGKLAFGKKLSEY